MPNSGGKHIQKRNVSFDLYFTKKYPFQNCALFFRKVILAFVDHRVAGSLNLQRSVNEKNVQSWSMVQRVRDGDMRPIYGDQILMDVSAADIQ